MHGRHFTFKSILSHSAITIVASSVTGTLVSRERPYVVQGPWLQVLIPDELAEKMAHEFQVFNTPHQVTINIVNRRLPVISVIKMLEICGFRGICRMKFSAKKVSSSSPLNLLVSKILII